VTGRKRKLVVAGAYGCGNVGDDAILAGMLQLFPPEKWDITVFTADPDLTRKYAPVRTLRQRLNAGFSPGILKEFDLNGIMRALVSADVFVIGGGALIHDLRIYNLPYFFLLHTIAAMAGARVLYLGIGVGTLKTRAGRRLCRFFMNRAAGILVRDEESRIRLCASGIHQTVHVGPDLAFALRPPENISLSAKTILSGEGLPDRYVAATVCGWFKSGDFWQKNRLDISGSIKRMAVLYDGIIESYDENILFLPTVTPHDRDTALRIQSAMKHGGRFYCIQKNCTVHETMALIGHSQWLLAMRLHSMIFAVITGVPFFALVYDDKVRYFLNQIGSTHSDDIDHLMDDRLFSRIDAFYRSRKKLRNRILPLSGLYRERLERMIPELAEA